MFPLALDLILVQIFVKVLVVGTQTQRLISLLFFSSRFFLKFFLKCNQNCLKNAGNPRDMRRFQVRPDPSQILDASGGTEQVSWCWCCLLRWWCPLRSTWMVTCWRCLTTCSCTITPNMAAALDAWTHPKVNRGPEERPWTRIRTWGYHGVPRWF